MQEFLFFISSSGQILLMHPLVALAIVCIAYTWVLTYLQVREAKGPAWHQTITLASVLSPTIQALLPFVMLWEHTRFERAHFRPNSLSSVDAPDPVIGWIAGLEVLFFLVSLPCALTRKGVARWLLASSSIFFLALTGFFYLVMQIRF
jgi:hypothetical protein